jgi:hypothetical protein
MVNLIQQFCGGMLSMQEGMDFSRGACSIWNCMMMLSEVCYGQ